MKKSDKKSSVILLASGSGSRLMPISLKCHKSLVPIKGKPNLVRIIDRLESLDYEIFIAANYDYKSQFIKDIGYRLRHDSVHIDFIKNPNNFNNSYTLMKMFKKYHSTLSKSNTFIIDCDNYITDYSLFMRAFNSYNYSGFFTIYKVLDNSYEWRVNSKKGKIISIDKNCQEGHMISGISVISSDDFPILLEGLIKNKDKSLYWEDIFIDLLEELNFPRRYSVDKYSIEYDDINDLLSNNLISNLEIAEILDDTKSPLRLDSMTNETYKILLNGEQKVLRLSKENTEFIDKSNEIAITELLNSRYDEEVTPKADFYNKGNAKLTTYLQGYSTWSSQLLDFKYLDVIMNRLHQFHRLPLLCSITGINLLSELDYYKSQFIKCYKRLIPIELDNYIRNYIQHHGYDKASVIHRDLIPNNIMVTDTPSIDCKLIDLEYSGILSSYWDLGCLASEMSLFTDDNEKFNYNRLYDYCTLVGYAYYGVRCDHSEVITILHWAMIVDYVWGNWGYAMDCMDYGNKRVSRSLEIYEKLKEESCLDQ